MIFAVTAIFRLRGYDLPVFMVVHRRENIQNRPPHPSGVIFVKRVNLSYVDKTSSCSPRDSPDPSMVEEHTAPTILPGQHGKKHLPASPYFFSPFLS
jgi:hypothetical protein